ncbi:MAG: hypothetical protein ACK4TA_06360 [Saprospiraceae bacterium]
MKNTKLIQVLKTLDKQELKAFDKYLTKLYNEHELVVSLFQYLKRFHPFPEESESKIDLEYITYKVFKLEKTKRISNEASKLLNWLEEFLLLEKIKRDAGQYEVQRLLIDVYKERKLTQFYFREIDKLKSVIQEERKDIWRSLHLMELNHAHYYHPFTEMLNPDETALNEAMLNAEAFYKMMTLKYQCELQNRLTVLQVPEISNLLDYNIIEKPKTSDEQYEIIHSLYVSAYQMFVTKSEEYYNQLKEALYQSAPLLDKEDQLVLLVALINYNAKLIRQGNRKALVDTFGFFKYGADNQILETGGYITEGRFQSAVNIACELDEFSWADNFVERYRHLLTDKSESAIALAKARILFSKKDFQEALFLLRNLHLEDKAFNYNTKLIELQCYYELKNTFSDTLESSIKAFEQQLRRNRILEKNIIDSAQNFLKILKSVVYHNDSKEKLLERLHTQPLIVGKYWLEEKIKELPDETQRQLRI